MLLSNTMIREALSDGRLSIAPNDHCAYDTTAVNLTLGPIIQVPKKKYPTALTVGEGNLIQFLNDSSDRHELTASQPFRLEPQQFLLASTFEVITLARESDRKPEWADSPLLAARVEGKSSYARLGVLVHFTAPTIHNGFSGVIALEIMNCGPYPIMLALRKPICQLLIEEVVGIPDQHESQFHGQMIPAGKNLSDHVSV
jgi:dCTP deaminase